MLSLLNPRLCLRTLPLVACAAVFAFSSNASALTTGDKAPSFALPVAQIKGAPEKVLRLDDVIANQPLTVVLFVATRCPYSNAYNDRMRQLATQFQKRGVAFVGVNSNVTEPASEVAAHRQKHKLPFPIVKDPGSKMADAFGATKTPEVFVLNREGAIVYHGRIDENYRKPADVKKPDLRLALNALLDGQPLKRSVTKAFGCSIKRPQ